MSRQSEKEARLRDAMAHLISLPQFREFMAHLRDQREDAVRYMIDHTTVKDQRESLAAAGEVRCWDTIHAVYENFRLELEQAAAERQEDVQG